MTKLPENVIVFGSSSENQASIKSEEESKGSIRSINRAQQAYYLENEKFTRKLAELDLSIQPEDENYRYQIVPQGNQTRSAIITAAAKQPQLRSYTGVVYTIKIKIYGETSTNTMSAICETDEPSPTPPAKPKIPKQESELVQCRAGSHLLKS